VVTVLFLVGTWAREDWGLGTTKAFPGCCLTVQWILFIVVCVHVFGQKKELAERQSAMQKLGFLNNCGDQFTQIPDYFVPDI